MRLLSPAEMKQLRPAETHAFRGPVPTQIVSSEEYFPTPQTAEQREVQLFALTTVAQPRLTAALMGMLVRGMGADHVIWGTDAVWTGAPQWQIEGLRRLEIPEDMQKKHGFAPLGAADGPVKNAILGENVARLYRYNRHAELAGPSRLAELKAEYERRGIGRSNRRYGYVVGG